VNWFERQYHTDALTTSTIHQRINWEGCFMAKNSGSSKIQKLLAEMNRENGFPISVLTDLNGLPIAAATQNGLDPERQSAVVAMVQKMAAQVGKQLGMAEADEISLFDANGQRLVCRPFNTKSHDLILAVIVPERQRSYRRITNQTISEIRKVWGEFWE
jgi:predicted regulator of Ras-like GTPase activity (Roadblock/LC7/MglB family)